MKNWKRLIALAMALCVMCATLAGCGGSKVDPAKDETKAPVSDEKKEDTAVEPITLKFNCIYSSTDPSYLQWVDFFEGMEEATGGAVKVEMYAGEALGPSTDTVEQAAQGEPIIANVDVAALANYVPDMAIGNAPYVFQEPQDIQIFWESPYMAEMEKTLGEEFGLKMLHLGYFGTRNLIANKEVHTRADISKLKIRCASAPMWNEVVRVLGGQATNTAWSETYSACSQGVADGAESPYSLLYSSKLYECCPYIINTEHLIAVTCPTMSYELFESLPEDVQQDIEEYSHNYCARQIELTLQAAEESKALLEAEGVTFIDVDKTEFIEAAAETPDHFPEWTDGLYEDIVAYINENRK